MIEVFRRKKRFFLVFEYLEHTVLEELEAKGGGLGYTVSRKYIYQVLRALDFIHSHDVSAIFIFENNTVANDNIPSYFCRSSTETSNQKMCLVSSIIN